jgi:hypothetical protein
LASCESRSSIGRRTLQQRRQLRLEGFVFEHREFDSHTRVGGRIGGARFGHQGLISLAGVDIQIGHCGLCLSWRERHQAKHCGKRNSLHEILPISSPPSAELCALRSTPQAPATMR